MMVTEPRPERVKAVGAEPLPGYRLLEPLGRGGFGEVWKCEAPGGLPKAIKFVRGATGLGDAGDSAALEFQAIQRIKAIRHPFLLSIERVEILDGEMVLVMELADRNLADLHAECRAAGRPGIGRDELLGYLAEAAEALDVMNIQHGLQHLDVKPANLFIVGNHLKVADFGLVSTCDDLAADGSAKQLGGLTPLYVAPEMLRGKMSRHSDQYSLAIVYQELLTGTLPFPGDNARRIMVAHLTNEPDLSALPDADRAAVARALAKDPAHRFPSCLHFLQALVFGPEPGSAAAAPLSRPLAQFRKTPQPAAVPGAGPDQTLVTKRPQMPPRAGANGAAADDKSSRETLSDSRNAPVTGLKLPGYHLVAQVSHGPLGALYLARDGEGKVRMIRYLPGDDASLDAPLLDRLRSVRHPALPPLEVNRHASGRVALVSDVVERTLLDRYEQCVKEGLKGVPREELLNHLEVAADALDALHRCQGLSHLGLCPKALLLADCGVRLGDFGLAQLAWLPRWQSVPHPNRRYAAPELLTGMPNLTCDVYSLALIFAEMLTGCHPLPKRLRSRSPAAPAKPDLDWLPAADRDVVARALHADPRERYQSCGELLAALCATGARPTPAQPAGAAELPFIRPLANLFGAGECPGGMPSINRAVTQVVLTESAAVTIGVANRLPYLQRADNVVESQFPIRMLPGMVRLRMDAFRARWDACLVSQTDRSFVLRLHKSGNFWQRCLGHKAGLEVRLDVQPARGASIHTSEVTATVRPFGGARPLAAQKFQEVGPLLLVSLRDELQNTPDQRGQVRWRCSPALDVYPVEADGQVTDVLEARGRDISFNGIGFWTATRVAARLVYVNLKTFPELAPFALLARVVRVQPCDGGYKIGAAFVTTGIEGI
jgi:serine/threonine protein kinase